MTKLSCLFFSLQQILRKKPQIFCKDVHINFDDQWPGLWYLADKQQVQGAEKLRSGCRHDNIPKVNGPTIKLKYEKKFQTLCCRNILSYSPNPFLSLKTLTTALPIMQTDYVNIQVVKDSVLGKRRYHFYKSESGNYANSNVTWMQH